MECVSDLGSLKLDASLVAIGSYDGVHVGHRTILQPMITQARAMRIPALMITFDPIPAVFFGRLARNSNITLPAERCEIVDALGIDLLVTLPFTKTLADLSAETFVDRLVAATGMRQLWVGEGFSFGKHRAGSARVVNAMSSRYGFELNVLARISLPDGEISSTRIRRHISDGEVAIARDLLTYPFFIRNTIQHGAKLGTKIGIPTLNMAFPAQKIHPAFGVYVTRTTLDGVTYDSITSVGVRPTFYDESDVVIETHLFDEQVDAYGKVAQTDFYEFVRPEIKYPDSAALITQIKKDIVFARDYLKSIPRVSELPLVNELPYQRK